MPSDLRDHRVYQFRHTSTWLAILAIPKAKTSDPTRTAASHKDDVMAVCAGNNRINAVRYSRTHAFFWLCVWLWFRYHRGTAAGSTNEPHSANSRSCARYGEQLHCLRTRCYEQCGQVPGVSASWEDRPSASSQLEVEEQCANAPRATNGRASLRVVWPPARS